MSHSQRGNAFVYILIAVVLFAALTFILARQEDEREANLLTPEQAKLSATQLINSAAQIKSGLDQMTFAGTTSDELDFVAPSSSGAFITPPHLNKVHHPQGGGVTLNVLPSIVIDSTVSSPDSGWYLGRFNHVEWTNSTAHDVVLAAYGIEEMVCQEINRIISGSSVVPVLASEATEDLFIDNGTQTNDDFLATECADCDGQPSFCVEGVGGGHYTFYNIILGE